MDSFSTAAYCTSCSTVEHTHAYMPVQVQVYLYMHVQCTVCKIENDVLYIVVASIAHTVAPKSSLAYPNTSCMQLKTYAKLFFSCEP